MTVGLFANGVFSVEWSAGHSTPIGVEVGAVVGMGVEVRTEVLLLLLEVVVLTGREGRGGTRFECGREPGIEGTLVKRGGTFGDIVTLGGSFEVTEEGVVVVVVVVEPFTESNVN
jgi:hypothetical protein